MPFVEAFREIAGVEFQPDSGAGRAGVYWYPTFMDPKLVKRSYARTGHYDGIERANYEVVANSKVTRVTLDGLRATGVVFKSTARNTTERITAKANKEVILAAGAIHTPQLLQLSGIGPRKLLDAAGIDTVVDLPGVGQNFQDHPVLPPLFTRKLLSRVAWRMASPRLTAQCKTSPSTRTRWTWRSPTAPSPNGPRRPGLPTEQVRIAPVACALPGRCLLTATRRPLFHRDRQRRRLARPSRRCAGKVRRHCREP